MATTYNNPTRFLDEAGLQALWERIYNGFAPRWQSYKPVANRSTSDDRKPADFVSTVESTKNGDSNTKTLNINFASAGTVKDSDNNFYGKDIVVQIPEVKASDASGVGGNLGLMTAFDKYKLDNVGNTAENTVTIKGVKVKNTELTLSNKFVNWDFIYDTASNELQIVDLNKSNTVLTRIDMDTVLSDAITGGFLTNAEIVNTNDKSESGLYLKLTFATAVSNGNTTSTKILYVSVADLVDIYTAGNGITIENGAENTADSTKRSSTITLKSAKASEIGGVKATVHNETTLRTDDEDGRDFILKINNNKEAFVNIPVSTLTVNSSEITNQTKGVISGSDKIKILKGYAKTANGTDGWTLTPSYAEVTLNKETSVSIGTATNSDDGNKIDDSITVVTGLNVGGTNGHTITPVTKTYSFNETHLSLGDDKAATAVTITTNDSNTAATAVDKLKVLTNIEVNDHTITKTYTTYEINVTAIDSTFISGLAYKVS